jgi:hypothetical protein
MDISIVKMLAYSIYVIACVYVYSDYIMSQQKPPPLPARICFYSGIYTSIISLVWIALYTLPRFDQLIQIKQGTSMTSVWLTYLLVVIANASHSWNYYELIDRTGSVCIIYTENSHSYINTIWLGGYRYTTRLKSCLDLYH